MLPTCEKKGHLLGELMLSKLFHVWLFYGNVCFLLSVVSVLIHTTAQVDTFS